MTILPGGHFYTESQSVGTTPFHPVVGAIWRHATVDIWRWHEATSHLRTSSLAPLRSRHELLTAIAIAIGKAVQMQPLSVSSGPPAHWPVLDQSGLTRALR